ncbi:hypothetical protein TYRP_014724 [Tyrophagus putrescentiae]|nr:hypothetical protein TYRP_014724 [Tyrophagus putrescentiae]
MTMLIVTKNIFFSTTFILIVGNTWEIRDWVVRLLQALQLYIKTTLWTGGKTGIDHQFSSVQVVVIQVEVEALQVQMQALFTVDNQLVRTSFWAWIRANGGTGRGGVVMGLSVAQKKMSRLIEDENPCPSKQCSRQADQASLAHREVGAIFRHGRHQSCRQGGNVRAEVRLLQRHPQLLVGVDGKGVEVGANRSGEEDLRIILKKD